MLTEIDKKILGHLYHNQRESYTKIAKKLNLSRTQVEYNIKKYIENGLIKSFVTIFDLNMFDYNQPIAIFVKLNKLSQRQNFLDKVPIKNLQGYGKVLNKYDLYLNLIFKDDLEKNKILSEILFNDFVFDYRITEPFEGGLFPLKFLGIEQNSNYFSYDSKVKTTYNLSQNDKNILECLKHNGRIKIIDISIKTGVSPELILYKINKWKKDGLILGNRIIFDMKQLGYYFTVIQVNIANMSKDNKYRIKKLAHDNNNVTSYGITNSKPNCFFNLTHRNYEDIILFLDSLNEIFKDDKIESEIISIKEEEYINLLPFLNPPSTL